MNNRHLSKLLDSQTLDQRLQVLGGLVDRGLSKRHLLADQRKLVHKLLVVRQVRALRDGAVG